MGGWKLLAVMLAFRLDSVAIGVFTAGRILLARLDDKTASVRSTAVTRAYTAGNFALQRVGQHQKDDVAILRPITAVAEPGPTLF